MRVMCEFAAVSTMAPPRCHRHQLLLVVLMLGIMGSSSFSSQEQCPPICACLGNTVDCSNGHLPQIPARLPSWTGILWVTVVLTAVTEQLIASHHIEETDAGVDRPLYLRNKLYDKLYNHKITALIYCSFWCHGDLPCGYTIPLG